ncbi:hypothetical protein GCM10010441_06980 [Kitasatospora paracochleata]
MVCPRRARTARGAENDGSRPMSRTVGSEHRAFLGELAELVRLARTALEGATSALTEPDGAADGVVTAEKALSELCGRIEEDAADTPPEPVAVVAGVHVGSEVEWLALLARRLLEIAWARQGSQPFPERVLAPLSGLAEAAVGLVGRAADVLTEGTPEGVADLLSDLHEAGLRQRLLYDLLLADPPPVGSAETAELTLLSCHYRQCAEHAAAIARPVVVFADAGVRTRPGDEP